MASTEKARIKSAIQVFYLNCTSKDKKNVTYHQFKDIKINGRPVYGKSGLYKMLETLDSRGSLDRKKGSGRPLILNPTQVKKLKQCVDHKTGQSQRKLGIKFKVDQKTIGNTLIRNGIKYRKRKRTPKQTPAQKLRQQERLVNFCGDMAAKNDPRDLVIDDESYFTFSGAGMPGNSGFYTSNPVKTPSKIKHRQEAKFLMKGYPPSFIWEGIHTKK